MSSLGVTVKDQGKASAVEILSKASSVIFSLEKEGELTANDIAMSVGEPVSSTYRLLTQLSSLGWVERGSRRGLYRLGLLFMRVGGLVEDLIDIRAVALPTLQELKSKTGATAYLCVRRGPRAVCIERLEGGEVRSLAMRIGDSLPLHTGAAPLALLAFLPHGEQTAYLSSLAGELSGTYVRSLEGDLRRIQDAGYSISDGDVTPGIAAVGAPIYNHRGELEASLSLSGLRHRVLSDGTQTAERVRRAGIDISHELGYRGNGER